MSAPVTGGGTGLNMGPQKQRGLQQTPTSNLGLNDPGTTEEGGPEWTGSRMAESAAGQPLGMGMHSMAPNLPDMQLASSINGSNPLWSATPQAQGGGGVGTPDSQTELAKVQNKTAKTASLPRAQLFGPAGVPSLANR